MKIAVLGTRGFVDEVNYKNNEQIMAASGDNTGNLMFQYSICDLFSPYCELFYVDMLPDGESIEVLSRCDFLVIPCADFITFEYDLTGLWERLRWTKIPIVAIGLGIGGSFSIDRISDVGSGTLAVLDHFKKYAIKIFVRGMKTKEALETLGFDLDKVHVTGCPSNFLSKNNVLKTAFESKLAGVSTTYEATKFLLYGDRYWVDSKLALERSLYRIFRTAMGSAWVVQSHKPIVDLVRPHGSKSNFYELSRDLNFLLKSLNPQGSMGDLIDDLERRFKIFFNINDWMRYSADFDFSVGLRLHGNMISFQSGVPSLWLAHDGRTSELMDLMALPSINEDKLYFFVESNDLNFLREHFSSQLGRYFDRRESLFGEFSGALSEIGVTIRGIQ